MSMSDPHRYRQLICAACAKHTLWMSIAQVIIQSAKWLSLLSSMSTWALCLIRVAGLATICLSVHCLPPRNTRFLAYPLIITFMTTNKHCYSQAVNQISSLWIITNHKQSGTMLRTIMRLKFSFFKIWTWLKLGWWSHCISCLIDTSIYGILSMVAYTYPGCTDCGSDK